MKKVVLIGDSIRMGYQSTVQEALRDVAEVWGPEENGGPSQRILDRWQDWILDADADVIHINCGLHDLKKEFGAEAHIPLAKYRENIEEILRRAKSETKAKVIWATTTPVHEKNHHLNKGFDRFEADVAEYNRVASAIAVDLSVPINDLFGAMQAADPERYLRDDGVHFTEEGSVFLGQKVAAFIFNYL